MNTIITNFAIDTENPDINFDLANEYLQYGHTASAISHYVRCLERTEDKLLIYECLLLIYKCFIQQQNRDFTAEHILKQAISIDSSIPEAYSLLCDLLYLQQKFYDCYTYSNIGLNLCNLKSIPYRQIPNEKTYQRLLYNKARSGIHWEKLSESYEIFTELFNNYMNDFNHEDQEFIKNHTMNNQALLPSVTSKKIFDCFRFFNEKELLELRYNILKDKVEKFIILQGDKTQSGNDTILLAEKYIEELNLPKDKFIILNVNLPSNSDPIHIKEEDIVFRNRSGPSNDTYENSLKARSRERILLDSLLSIMDQFQENDIFMVSDCDEIINPDYIDWFTDIVSKTDNGIIKIPLVELHNKANLRAYYTDTGDAVQSDMAFFICTKKHFEKCTPFRLRFEINNPFTTLYATINNNRVEDCGWHFSWFGDANKLILKNQSTSHYADKISTAHINDMNSIKLGEFIQNWQPVCNNTNVWGDNRIVLKTYDINKLPKEIFILSHLTDFFISESLETIDSLIDKLDINGSEKFCGTDKFTTHNYLNFYRDILSQYQNKSASILELGIYKGGFLLLLSKYLKFSNIIGVDIEDNIDTTTKNKFDSNTQFIFQDAYTTETIDKLQKLNPDGFDLIIDDGPHTEQSQIDAIKLYVPLLKENGSLIIEDIADIKSINKFKDIILTLNNNYYYDTKTYDYREVKSRYDDIIFIIQKKALKPIPVFGVPIVNGVHWLEQLIESIDYPINNFFIVNNSSDNVISLELDNVILKYNKHSFIENIRVCHLPHNIGVSGAWNLIIKSYLMSPYWILCNNDVSFTPGFLKEMVMSSMNDDIGFVSPPGYSNEYSSYGTFECFLIKDWVVDKCGLFNENFYPAYCEDNDYFLKLLFNKISKAIINTTFYHGGTTSYEYSGSQTIKLGGSSLEKKINNAHQLNREYLTKLWGKDWEEFKKINFNVIDQPLNYNFDLSFNRKKYLGF